MFGYASDVVAMADLTEEQHERFEDFCSGAVATIGWTTHISTEDGAVYEYADETPEWNFNHDDIQDIVLTVNIEELLGFFVECYSELLDCSPDFSQHGHDYVLTAGGHGAGFWDRGYPKRLSDALCDAANGGTSSHVFWFESSADDVVLRYEQG